MRAGNFVWAALAAAGCGGDPREACDALMLCARTVNPFLVEDLAAEYGEAGRCWAEQDGAACEQACTDEMVALWLPSGAATCDPEPITGTPMLSEPQFAEAYWAFLCDLYVSCTGRDSCPDETPDQACYGGRFDPERAAACLEEPPFCSDQGDWSYVEVSEPCREVCDYGY
jgi:hypothetical protein